MGVSKKVWNRTAIAHSVSQRDEILIIIFICSPPYDTTYHQKLLCNGRMGCWICFTTLYYYLIYLKDSWCYMTFFLYVKYYLRYIINYSYGIFIKSIWMISCDQNVIHLKSFICHCKSWKVDQYIYCLNKYDMSFIGESNLSIILKRWPVWLATTLLLLIE